MLTGQDRIGIMTLSVSQFSQRKPKLLPASRLLAPKLTRHGNQKLKSNLNLNGCAVLDSFGGILMQPDHAKPQLVAPSCWKTAYVYMYSFNLLPNSLFLHQQTGSCFSSPSLKHPKLGRGTLQMVLQTTHLSHSTNNAVRSQWYPSFT